METVDVKQCKGVIFDMGGVIYPNTYTDFTREQLLKKNLGLSKDAMQQLFAVGHELLVRFELGEFKDTAEVDRLFNEKILETMGLQVDFTGLIRSVLENFLAAKPYSEMIQSIVTLRRKGFKTALLTNNFYFNGGTLQPVDESLFDVVVQSCVERMRKPDPRIYELTLDRLQLRASDVVFLDDTAVNVESAREMGIRSILVTDRFDALRELEEVVGVSLLSV